jgi:glycosyltransferase involved in cell wall biosynthesis
MKTLAIIMTAYKTEKYIIEAIDSLKNQPLPDGWQSKFYIGVDACKDVANILTKHNISYYWTDTNVGTYVLSNSLLKEAAGADVFVRFDSDDVALDGFLQNGIAACNSYDFVYGYCRRGTETLELFTQDFKPVDGVHFFTQHTLDVLGGFDSYRVACDTYFIKRAEQAKLKIAKDIKNPEFIYRRYSTSVMSVDATRPKSQHWRVANQNMRRDLKQKKTKVLPNTTKLTLINK